MSIVCLAHSNVKAQSTLPVQWVKSGIQVSGNLNPVSLGTDELGNVYTALIISDTFNFSENQYPAMFYELFITKVDPDGRMLWERRIDSMSISNTRLYINVKSNGNFYISGSFNNFLSINNLPSISTISSNNFYLASFDSSGNALWVKYSNNDNQAGANINVLSITSDAYSNIYIGGEYLIGEFIIDTDTLHSPKALARNSAFLIKFDINGNLNWATEIAVSNQNSVPSSAFVYLTSVKASEQGNVYLYGSFHGNLAPNNSTVLSSGLGYDYFIIKYETSGDLIWSKKINCNGDCLPGIMELDYNENLFVTGTYQYQLNLGSLFFNLNYQSNLNSFVLKYNTNGLLIKAKELPINQSNNSSNYAYDLNDKIGTGSAVDLDGNFYITGSYSGDFHVGSHTLSNSASKDIFVVKYNSDLNVVWLKSFTQNIDPTFNAEGRDIHFDDFGNAYLLGAFNYRTDIGSSMCKEYAISNGLNAEYDMFLARIWFNEGELNYSPVACISQNINFEVSQSLISNSTTFLWSFPGSSNISSSLASPIVHYTNPGVYEVKVRIYQKDTSCNKILSGNIVITDCLQAPSCSDCIPSFSPSTGKNYVVSAWAKEEKIGTILTSYDDATLRIVIPGYGEYDFHPEGEIIDGWQRLEGQFFLPDGYEEIVVKLLNTLGNSSALVYFDDVRVAPTNANLKTFVYHPVNKKLMAELDNQNYATFYEYDDDGELIRIKKETSKGIVTLKESRKNIKKDE